MRFSRHLKNADSWHNIESSMLLPHLLDIPPWQVDLLIWPSSIAPTLGGGELDQAGGGTGEDLGCGRSFGAGSGAGSGVDGGERLASELAAQLSPKLETSPIAES